MTDHAPFLSAILAAPSDDLPRLIYADWLDERGDPRGEFIRLQIASHRGEEWARTPEASARAEDLLAEHRSEWQTPVASKVLMTEFHRGFVDRVIDVADQFLKHHQELFRSIPFTSLTIIRASQLVTEIFELCEFARLQALHLTNNLLTDSGIEIMSRRGHLGRLELLRLGNTMLSERGAMEIANSHRMPCLRDLVLTGNNVGSVGVEALLLSDRFRLRSLQIYPSDVPDSDRERLGELAESRGCDLQYVPEPFPVVGAMQSLSTD